MKKLLLILLCVPLIGFGQTAEEYFEKAYDYGNKEQYQLAIDNYTKCIKLKPGDANLAKAYYNRGSAYDDLENYEDAIADFIRAIRIEPDYVDAFRNRGIAKEKAGLYYCSDYKRGCELGDKDCCKWYDDQCR